MNSNPDQFLEAISRLRDLGWRCVWRQNATSSPSEILERYSWLPDDYLNFTASLQECVSPDETQWILSPSDFDRALDHAFAHDEWERISVEAADGDAATVRKIRRFWDAHMPIHFDVSTGYSYHAICVGDRTGHVVCGREPVFEDVEPVVGSFTEFLHQLS